MKTINKLYQLARVALAGGTPVVAVVWPDDMSTLLALRRALNLGLAKVVAVGCREKVNKRLAKHVEAGTVTVVDADSPVEAAAIAVSLAREGTVQVVMKGLVNTDVLLRAVLDKKKGLLPEGNVLTHVTIGEIPTYSKLLLFGDVAVLPMPTLEQREAQLRNIIVLARALGIACPHVALAHCSEKVDERHFPVTADYVTIINRAGSGEYGDCLVGGPMDVKTACDAHAARVKGITSPVAGNADAIIFPEIESGNAFYKAMTLFGGMSTAAVVCGADVPLVMPSRGDDFRNKFYSLAAARLLV